MKDEYRIEKDYKDNDILRKSFNTLAEKTFGFNFEQWYQRGYWRERYVPYSVLDGERVVANVSVNIMKFNNKGKEKNYIQLGTVMTDKAYRGKGLSRLLIEKILKEYKDVSDGIFLFANDSVLEFYPKFGFKKATEYQYEKQADIKNQMYAEKVSVKNINEWKIFENAVNNSVCSSSFQMVDNVGLIMFYIFMFMEESVYYIREENAYVIAEKEKNNLVIHDVFSPTAVNLDRIISAFGNEISHVTLGFAPIDKMGFKATKVNEEDTTLFVYGKDFEMFDKEHKKFPSLSHA